VFLGVTVVDIAHHVPDHPHPVGVIGFDVEIVVIQYCFGIPLAGGKKNLVYIGFGAERLAPGVDVVGLPRHPHRVSPVG